MGWFNKKEDVKAQMPSDSLPELPKLPELPPLRKNKEIHNQLPKIPNNSFGESFSHNSIKEAVTRESKNNFQPEGRKGETGFVANDFAKEKKNMQMMPKPRPQREFNFPRTEEIEEPLETSFDFETGPELEEETFETEDNYSPLKKEPVFIRIDKFEDALKTFEKAKKEIVEIEKVLTDITNVRTDEDRELESWKNNIVKIKEQIEKVDSDIFSKIE